MRYSVKCKRENLLKKIGDEVEKDLTECFRPWYIMHFFTFIYTNKLCHLIVYSETSNEPSSDRE